MPHRNGKYPQLPILLVDDETPWLRGLELALQRNLGINNVVTCQDSRDVPDLLERLKFSLIILDISMPFVRGDELLEELQQLYPMVPVIVTTGLNQVDLAVRCVKSGAYDYFVKTEEERIMGGIRRALAMLELQEENSRLRDVFLDDVLSESGIFARVRTRSKKMRAIFRYVEAIAHSNEPVLVLGESGVGKELIARSLHDAAGEDLPWVAVNVAGLDDNVFSDTLFGHEKGAFTGADKSRAGVVEEASGGTLFLDEIGDLSVSSQLKLLRLLQEGEYYPLGSDKPRRASTRIVCATNRDLSRMQAEGTFRSDLYYRLNAHRIEIPSLRERLEDIPLLADQFLREAAEDLDKELPVLSLEGLAMLSAYTYPGNVRELRAIIFEALSKHDRGELTGSRLKKILEKGDGQLFAPDTLTADQPVPEGDRVVFPARLPSLKEVADLLVDEAMRRSDDNQTHAARLLGISRPALSKRLKNRSG